jgi:hypothetical protein
MKLDNEYKIRRLNYVKHKLKILSNNLIKL